MACEYCRGIYEHDARCPLYKEPKHVHCCSACGQGILDGEEYIVNDDGEYRHYECFYGMKDLLEWLGYEIKTMEATNERSY